MPPAPEAAAARAAAATASARRAAGLLLAACLAAACGAAHAAPSLAVRLIGINDFHGNLEPGSLTLLLADPAASAPDAKPLRVPVGGAAALAGMVRALRAGAPNSVMVSGGDLIGAAPMVSTLFRHESTIEVMNAIGLDVGITGNHEFDNGFRELLRVEKGGCDATVADAAAMPCGLGPYRGMRFPLLAANVIDARGRPALAPYAIVRRAGIRIGFIGAVTRTTPGIVTPSGVAGLRFIDEADSVNAAARQLRARGVRAIVAIFHEGGELGSGTGGRGDWNDPSCPGGHGPIFGIAERLVPEISVVFSAHTHQGYRCIVGGRTIIQGTSYGRGISVVDIRIDRRTRRIIASATRSMNLPVLNDRTPPEMRETLAAALPAPYGDVLRTARPDPKIAAMVARYEEVVAPKANRAIGRVSGRFGRAGLDEVSAAGRLVADAQLAATAAPADGGAEIAFINPGGIRADLECDGTPPCVVTFGQLFTMQPFGNSLVVVPMTGAQLKILLESQQNPGAPRPTMMTPSGGFTYTWHTGAADGQHVQDMALDGQPIAPDRTYRVTVNNFMAEGGDGYVFPRDAGDRRGGGQDLDALIAYLRAPSPRAPVAQPGVVKLP